VLKNGVSARIINATNIDVLMVFILWAGEFRWLKDTVKIYFLKRNCSCENVLWAIGVFRFVNLDCDTGCTKKDGTCEVSAGE